MNQNNNLPTDGVSASAQKRVLIIEDDPENSKLLKKEFEEANDYSFQVEIAKKKEDGIRLLEQEKCDYDVIIVDRLLQGEWGEFPLLNHDLHNAISIIWTAHFNADSPTAEQMENLKECMRLGARDYISKREENTYEAVVASAVKELRKLERERQAAQFLSPNVLAELLRKAEKEHRGKWIAIQHGHILAVAPNKMRLVDAVSKKKEDFDKKKFPWAEPIVVKIPSTPLMLLPEEE